MQMKEAEQSPSPEAHLGQALAAQEPQGRLRHAEVGLSLREELTPDTEALLLRQVYLAQLELGRLADARQIAQRMARVGALRDVALHDLSRVCLGMQDADAAIEAQRLACRAAPPERRSFHLWSLATLQHHGGDIDGALTTLDRALRWSRRDRPLLRAHRAYVRLEAGRAVRSLGRVVQTLEAAPCREGYGRYLLGMLAVHMGDRGRAAVHLRAFLRRNADVDRAKAMTLGVELRRARRELAVLESD